MCFRVRLLLLIAAILAVFTGCDNSKKQVDFSQYISGYTSGVLKSSSSICVFLNGEANKSYQPGSALPENIMKFSPAIKGELFLKDDKTIEFIPSERLKNGTSYTAALDLGALCDVPEKFKKFSFKFDIIPLSVMYEAGLLLTEPEAVNALMYEAALVSSDYIDGSEIENKLTATFDGKTLTPEWSHEGNRHKFTLRELAKSDDSRTLTIAFGKDINEGRKEEISIPAITDFTVLNVNTQNSEPPVINIHMSENVDANQNLDGLIKIDGISSFNYKVSENIINIYPSSKQESGVLTLHIRPGIKSTTGNRINVEFVQNIRLISAKPEVKLIGKGVIVPDDNKVLIPFSAVSLKAVDIEILQVLNQNMNFFFQENNYEGRNEINRTARPIFIKKIDLLEKNPNIDLGKWNDFTVNLADLVKLEKGVVYRIRLKFKKSYTTLDCANEFPDSEYPSMNWDSPNYYYSEYSYPPGYEWSERDNPCHVSYYIGERFVSRNIVNTSLGLMAKRGSDNRYYVCVTDIVTAEPVADCQIILYNFQNQKIDSARTDRNGFADMRPENTAYIALAQKGNDRAWLRLNENNALSLSNFDVSGQHVQMGVKGFIYGERGVWRPGDNIYLSLILEDKMNVLPDGHPIVGQLIDPNGNVVETRKGNISGSNNINSFIFKTAEDAPTGYWRALFRIGGLSFTQTLRVETIKPNRLAIDMELPNEDIVGQGISKKQVKVKTKWLNGAKTSNLKAITEVRLYNGQGGFKEFSDYTFSDKSKYFESESETLFDGETDGEGNFSFDLSDIRVANAPGVLNATFTNRVFESGGDYSISTQTVRYSPYTQYVGIRMPESEDNWYSTRKSTRLNGVIVSPTGEKKGSATVKIEAYRLSWYWWWDSDDENIGSYINREHSKSVLTKSVQATDGAFHADLNIDTYGRYYIRATLPDGHSTGIIAYFGSWSETNDQDNATILRLSTDKKEYQTGEKIKLTFPSSAGATAIISHENGKSINNLSRVKTQEGSTTIEIDAVSDMCPNTYIGVTLIQPHDRGNDRPIRLYGIVNVNVKDASLYLNPEIKVAEELRPAQDFKVDVKEKDGKPMNYTIAIVDEGLLSLTTFRTPNPFPAFYAREALGVKTWDFYDYIYGAYGARLDKAFAVGGDEALEKEQEERSNRFKPVVLFAGPFSLKAGQTGTHSFKMPDYIGQVRTMVVAATTGKYGSATAHTTVNKPLMVSVAMPRLFTPGDIIDIPVTVFAMKDGIRDVSVKLNTDSKITLLDGGTRNISFAEKGEKVIYFKARIGSEIGTSPVRVEANSGQENAVVTENVTIRIPNPRITKIEEKEVKPGESVSFSSTFNGVEPVSVLEISSIPPLNLEQRLSYLLGYPHGCGEQITSRVFPQLSLPWLLALSPEQSFQAENNVRDVITRLRKYQTSEGGFAYWPGGYYVSEWVTTYIVHFLAAAQQNGFSVPVEMFQNAVNYLRRISNNYSVHDRWAYQQQAYRLYVLAYAGKPEMAAMNRLKETENRNITAKWVLAGAYALANQQQIAANMIRNTESEVSPYRQTGGTYGSNIRDYALILQSMVAMDMQQDAYRILEKISKAIGSSDWYSTQETAFALHSAALYVKKYLGTQQGIEIIVTTALGDTRLQMEKSVWQTNLPIKDNKATASVRNNGKGILHARQISSSAPLEVVKEKIASNLSMTVKYEDASGNSISLENLKRGSDVIAEITVTNTGVSGTYNELALTYLVPSGFEIINDRMTGEADAWSNADYVDIRDDRFYVYMSLDQNRSKTFRFRCNAAFSGEYLLPAINCMAMYDNTIQAVVPGGKIKIN